MVKILDDLRNDPSNETHRENLARLLFKHPDELIPAIQREVPHLAPQPATVIAHTVATTRVASIGRDLEAATSLVERAVKAVPADLERGVEGLFEGAKAEVTAHLGGEAVPSTLGGALDAAQVTALIGMPKVGRVVWANFVGTQLAQPLKIEKPSTLDELKAVMNEAATIGCPVRAVGSAHSWSDSALTDGIVIETHGLNRMITLNPGLLKKGVDVATLVQCEAGIVLHDLILQLEKQEPARALINMGGYDGQTLAGVISTSTHGSGITLGSFSSAVAALIVVTADGKVLQIEKTDGITDPAAFKNEYGTSRELRQDDDLFSASVVGVGSLGVIYAAIINVIPLYYLQEVRVILPWTEVKKQLQGGLLDQYRHVEVLFNPHKTKGQNSCLLTTRKIVPKPWIIWPKPLRNVFAEFLASQPGADKVLAFVFNEFPTASPELIDQALVALVDPDPWTDVYYKVLNVGAVNGYAAVCAEYGIDLDKYIASVDAVLETAAKYQQYGIYHSSPSALRWVAASPGYLSMQPVPTCMIEMPNLQEVFGYPDIYWRYEEMLTKQFGARPHWGQMNFLTGSRDMIGLLYPQLDKWLAKFQEFNADGRFKSVFTDRVGFSSHAP